MASIKKQGQAAAALNVNAGTKAGTKIVFPRGARKVFKNAAQKAMDGGKTFTQANRAGRKAQQVSQGGVMGARGDGGIGGDG
jgi:hypothetical protein